MTGPHHLEASLRTLRLSGMLDTLGARLDQARAGELGHLEFLQVLCEDEIGRRAATALARRVRAARFEQTYTLEDFDFAYTWPPGGSSTPASPSSCMGPSEWARAMSLKR
jgi:DNA replication protein DnaC